MIYWSYKMKIRRSDLKLIVEEVMNEAPGLAQQTKGLAKGAVTGPPPNHKQITKLIGGTNGWSGLIDKLDRNVAALKKAKAIDVSTAHALDKAISKMTKDFRVGAKAQGEKWKKTGKQ